MRYVIKEAATIDEALSAALKDLKVSKKDTTMEIIQNPSNGILGLFNKKLAKIKVNINFDEINITKHIVSEFLKILNIEATINVEKINKNTVYISIDNDNVGYLIGKHGITLKALEQIFALAINKKSPYRLSIILDIGNYISKRKASLEKYATNICKKVLKTKQKFTLDPMSSYERKVIHTTLQQTSNIKTYSIGVSPDRKVVIEYTH